MNWTIEQLRYFVAAAEEGSISAAARRLGKAQSAVSTAISLLEADLGFELFDRSRRNARLTDQGEVMLLEAKELLRQAEGLNHRANALAFGEQPQLSLALDEALPYQAVSELVRDLAYQFAYLELTLLNGTSTEVAEYVEKQRADIGFHVDRGAISSALGHKYVGAAVPWVFVAPAHAQTADAAPANDILVVGQTQKPISIEPRGLSVSLGDEQFAGVNAANVEDLMKYAPDCFVRTRFIGDNNAVPGFRGTHSTQSARTLAMVDGFVISNFLGNSFNFPPAWGVVSPNEVQQFDIVYGPYSARYGGNSMGGIVNITTRPPDKMAKPVCHHDRQY